MELSKNVKTFGVFLTEVLESTLNFEQFEKKISVTVLLFLKLLTSEHVVTKFHKRSCF